MAELKINEKETIRGSVNEIMDYLDKRYKRSPESEIYCYVIDKGSNINKALHAVLKNYDLENLTTNSRIDVLNLGCNAEMAYKLIQKIADELRAN